MTTILNDWDKAGTLLAAASRVVILTHVSPDGDAIGSLLGLGHALLATGRQVIMAVDEGVPPNLQFLPGSAQVLPSLAGVTTDLVIVVDCSDERRVGKVGEAARRLQTPWINIDHHVTNVAYADANIMDPAFVSASEAVLNWLHKLNLPLSPDVAQCLLCGLVTDTLCFRISSVTAVTFAVAQELMAAGANLSEIVQNTIARMPTSALLLWKQVMPSVRIEDQVTWARLTLADKQAAAFDDKNSDGGLVSFLLQADDAYISCIFKEKENNQVEISLRSVPGFDVGAVAFNVGGGGHKQASGATLDGTIDEVEAKIIPLLKAAAQAGAPLFH
ncbi:MAG: bifunctional oligoribonuclease/PAP phosphatase NrnA [Anaerolineae bacterium]|nr:bifunctional oligoribonuclease/PAP phosphatase NrnA [Anaerolineae bacterium]